MFVNYGWWDMQGVEHLFLVEEMSFPSTNVLNATKMRCYGSF